MSYQSEGSSSAYAPMPKVSGMSEDLRARQDAAMHEAMDQQLWAEAQNIALSKIKMYHSMAKEIYDQN